MDWPKLIINLKNTVKPKATLPKLSAYNRGNQTIFFSKEGSRKQLEMTEML